MEDIKPTRLTVVTDYAYKKLDGYKKPLLDYTGNNWYKSQDIKVPTSYQDLSEVLVKVEAYAHNLDELSTGSIGEYKNSSMLNDLIARPFESTQGRLNFSKPVKYDGESKIPKMPYIQS